MNNQLIQHLNRSVTNLTFKTIAVASLFLKIYC